MTLNPGDNAANLPADYIASLEKLPARLRRRFLEGLYGDTAPDALWTEELIERYRVNGDELPRFLRIVVAIDPSGSGDEDNADNDEIGIIVVGLGIDGNAYLLEDATVKAGESDRGGNELRRRNGQVRRAGRKAWRAVQETHGLARKVRARRAHQRAARTREDSLLGKLHAA